MTKLTIILNYNILYWYIFKRIQGIVMKINSFKKLSVILVLFLFCSNGLTADLTLTTKYGATGGLVT